MCPDTCSEGWEEVAERRRVLRAGAMKRAALVVDVAAEVENQRKRLELMDSEVRAVFATYTSHARNIFVESCAN
jgi:hypothetical protein